MSITAALSVPTTMTIAITNKKQVAEVKDRMLQCSPNRTRRCGST